MRRAASVIDLSLPGQREIVRADSSILTRLPGPVLVDEWQRLPRCLDIADPALAARLLGLDAAALLRAEQGGTDLSEGTILGALFEHLVALSVHTHAEAAEARVAHLRTRNNDHEVDLLVQHSDGRVLGIEVKLADRVEDADTRHLQWLRNRIGTDLIDAVVIYAGERAYRRRDGVAVVPLALFGP